MEAWRRSDTGAVPWLSSVFATKSFTGAKFVKGFNHLGAAILATDLVVEGPPDRLSLKRRRGRDRSRGGFGQTTRVRTRQAGKAQRGGALVHARGRTWGQLIFQDLFKKDSNRKLCKLWRKSVNST